MKNSAGRGECYPPRPKAEVDAEFALLFIQNIIFGQNNKYRY